MTDVRLTEDGDLPEYTEHIDGLPEVMQRIRIRLHTFAGEWMLDTRQGLPFFDWLKQKPINQARVENRIRAGISGTPGVESVVSMAVDFRRDSRTVEVSGTVDTEYGSTDLELELDTG